MQGMQTPDNLMETKNKDEISQFLTAIWKSKSAVIHYRGHQKVKYIVTLGNHKAYEDAKFVAETSTLIGNTLIQNLYVLHEIPPKAVFSIQKGPLHYTKEEIDWTK